LKRRYVENGEKVRNRYESRWVRLVTCHKSRGDDVFDVL
jgi:hypothetical protein